MSARFETKKLSSFQLGFHHFNPPPKASSYQRANEVLSTIRKELGGLNAVFRLKGQRDAHSI